MEEDIQKLKENNIKAEKIINTLLEKKLDYIFSDTRKNLFAIPLHELIKKPINPFPYLVDKMIPSRAITTITGDTGSGKSIFILHLADCVSRGEKLFNEYNTQKTNILIIDLEMDEDLLINRCQSVCKDQENKFIVYEKIFKIENPDHVMWLKHCLKENNIGMIIFDTLSKIHNQDENSNTDMTNIMERLKMITIECDVSIVLLHHHNKSVESYGLTKSRGASSIQDNSASYLQIATKDAFDKDGKVYKSMTISQEKRRRPESFGKIGVNIYYDQEKNKTEFVYLDIIDNNENRRSEAKDIIVALLTEQPGLRQKQICDIIYEKNIVGKSIIIDVLKNLERNGEVITEQIGRSHQKLHYLPKDLPQSFFEKETDIESMNWGVDKHTWQHTSSAL